MLTTLRIKNLALVTDLTLELQAGYNVITGETGAGKSILIGALSLVLGERADRTLIRSGSDACSVEAVFDVSPLAAALGAFLDANGLERCEDSQLMLKRAFTVGGTNRQFVNGSPTTLNILAELGQLLVDIHGPHEHQSLLRPACQLEILDAYGKLETARAEFATLLHQRSALLEQKAALIIDEKTAAQQVDLLRFQVNEIGAARLQPGEETSLEDEYRRSSNSARLLELTQSALDLLGEADSALLTQAGALGRMLSDLSRLDPGIGELVSGHQQAVASLRELQAGLARYAGKIEVAPERLRELEERLNVFHSLKRKYGPTAEAILAFAETARRQLVALEQRDTEVLRLNAELARLEQSLWQTGKSLSANRRKVIPQLCRAVSNQLSDLGFRQNKFEIELTSAQPPAGTRSLAEGLKDSAQLPFASSGLDDIEFLFAPNPGEPPRPLRAIASSGELARVMLALKTVLAAQDKVPVLVFDEVDANVGGETAHVVGEKMRQIAKNRQVLCITHLAQVAAPATAHFVATKKVKSGRSVSEIALLDGEGRISELTRMLGGQTEAARGHAEALLDRSRERPMNGARR